jgi:hypothetical protein
VTARALKFRVESVGATALLASATAVAIVSFYFFALVKPNGLTEEVFLGYIPVMLGGVSMWLCLRARKKAARKRLVLSYAIVLAPFAFNYPASLLILWLLYVSGRYHGPMP